VKTHYLFLLLISSNSIGDGLISYIACNIKSTLSVNLTPDDPSPIGTPSVPGSPGLSVGAKTFGVIDIGSATGRGRAVGQNIKYDIDALFPLMGESHSIVDTSGSDYKDFANSYLQDSKAVRSSERFKNQALYLRDIGDRTEGADRLRFENLWEKYYNKGEGGTNANLSRVIALYNSPAGADFRTRNNIYNQVNSLQNDWVASGRSLESFARAFIKDLD